MKQPSIDCYLPLLQSLDIAKKWSGAATRYCIDKCDPISIANVSVTHAAIAALQQVSDEIPQVIITALAKFNAITDSEKIDEEIRNVSALVKLTIAALVKKVEDSMNEDFSAYAIQNDTLEKCIENTHNCNQAQYNNVRSQMRICANPNYKGAVDVGEEKKGCFDYNEF